MRQAFHPLCLTRYNGAMTDTIASIYSRDALRDDCAVSIEAYYLKDWQGYDMAPHRHGRMEIMYVLSGRCEIRTGEGAFTMRKGEFILLDAAVSHGLRVELDAVCRMMNIEFVLERRACCLPLKAARLRHPPLRQFLADARPTLVFADTEDVEGLLRRILNCLDGRGEGRALELELLTAELLLTLSRLYEDSGNIRNVGDIHVRRAMQFLAQNHFREIGVGDVAAHVGIAGGYLSRLFRRKCGQTVVEYLTALRITRAKMLLEKTSLPVVDVAGSVGVPSRRYFNELFKKHTGSTPGEYRRARARREMPGPSFSCQDC